MSAKQVVALVLEKEVAWQEGHLYATADTPSLDFRDGFIAGLKYALGLSERAEIPEGKGTPENTATADGTD